MRISLAVKYRPTTFEEVCGQSLTIDILKKSLQSNSLKNCLLFSGQSGAGKTTIARILANYLNNGNGSPIELDCASVGNVDTIRAIIDSANERSLDSTYKVFILDECHAITPQGWQAFLKCIEEPPLYTIFIFCTTDPYKIPSTILNRVQRYNISKISTQDIFNRLMQVCAAEKLINYKDTCDLISKLSQGSLRDALTMLDKCVDYSEDLSISNTKQILGDISYEVMLKLTNFLYDKNEAKLFAVVESLYTQGADLRQFISLYLDFILDITKYKIFNTILATSLPEFLLKSEDAFTNLDITVNRISSLEWLKSLIELLLDLKALIKYDSDCKSTIEAYFLKYSAQSIRD